MCVFIVYLCVCLFICFGVVGVSSVHGLLVLCKAPLKMSSFL